MMSKNGIRLLAVVILVLPLSVFAQGGKVGLGVIIGDPTGLSLKVWTGRSMAFDAAAAWSLGEKASLQLHADQLFHGYGLFRVTRGRMPYYYGFGARVLVRKKPEDKTVVGARFPLGFEYLFDSVPFGIFLEIVPILDLVPGTDFDINAAVGVRYYF